MSDPTDPRKDYAHTYFVQDRSNQDERDRLQVQDQGREKQALREIQHPDFVATVDLLTAWGINARD